MPRSFIGAVVSAAIATTSLSTDVRARQRVADTRQPAERTITFTESAGSVDNPGRGFSVPVGLTGRDLSTIRDQRGATLVRIDGRLDAWREQDLPASLLQSLDARLDEARASGLKAILRFMYNEGPYPNSAPDASLDWIKRHIAQLKPVLQKHAAVIAWLEAGFIGAWGEWHSSTHGLDHDMEAKRTVVNALLDALPRPHSILLRYPGDLAALFGTTLSARDIHGGTAKSRIGHHNDCFLASDTDTGTYGRGQRSIAQEKAIISSYGKYNPIGGETCAVNHPRSDCPTALAELERLGFSELNLGYHPGVLDEWRRGGCFETIKGRFGYRLWVQSITLPQVIVAGEDARITIVLHNSGFAAPLAQRPAYLVLDGPVRRTFKLPIDPRNWTAGQVHTIDLEAEAPASLPQGKYALSLWLPDDAPGLRADPRYAIRLANDGLWDEDTGHNRLVGDVVVRPARNKPSPKPGVAAPMGRGTTLR